MSPGRPAPGLAPVAVCFCLFGAFWGAWAVAAADVERSLGVSSGGFGLILSAALAGAAVANAYGGTLAERLGARPVLVGSLGAWAAALVWGALSHRRAVLAVALCVTIAVGGLVDLAMNVTSAAALADRPGRLVRFHALFNAGAAAGAGANGLLLHAHHTWRPAWLAAAAGAVVVAGLCAAFPLPAGEPGEPVGPAAAGRLLREEGLVVLAVAFAVAAMVEGGVELWGVLFLRTQLSSGLLVGAGGAVVAYLVAASARTALGPRVGSLGAARGVAAGAGLCAAGAALMAGAPSAPLAAVGLVVAAGGISMCWPLLVALTTAGRPRPGVVVGAVTAVGYLGFVVGPAVVGAVSEGVGLRAGLGLLAAAAVGVAAVGWRRRAQPVHVAPQESQVGGP